VATFDLSILNRRGLGKRVLALLQSKHALPEEGIIAGQSVASAIDELYKLTPPVYNDIDVFLSAPQWQSQTGEDAVNYRAGFRSRILGTVAYKAEKIEVMPAEYSRVFLISDRHLYTVVKARTDGLINRVWVSWSLYELNRERTGPRAAARVAAERAITLIAGFDLNCTQVAVDIRSGRLSFTPAFAQYFSTRQLNIVRTFTPIQSLLRYLKKRQELLCWGNDEAHIELVRRLVLANELDQRFRDERINTFIKGRFQFTKKTLKEVNGRTSSRLDQTLRVGTGVEGAPLAFGKKYAGLLDQYGNELAPYFDTTRHSKKELFLFSSRDDAPPLPERAQLPLRPTAQPRRFWQIYLPPSKLNALRRAEFERFVAGLPGTTSGLYAHTYSVHGDAYLEGAESPSGLADLSTVLAAHPEVGHVIVTMQMGLQIALIRLARTHMKKANLPNAWGIFAGKSPYWATKALTVPRLIDLALARMKGTDEPVVDPLPLPATYGTIEVRELRSSKALRDEGDRMRHCVGGYIGIVERGRSRIVSLKAGPSSRDCSTIEWAVVETAALHKPHRASFGDNVPLQLAFRQNYSFGNTTPKAALNNAEVRLREDLNAWLLANPQAGWDLLRPGGWQALPDL
jgi:hypothetical protein